MGRCTITMEGLEDQNLQLRIDNLKSTDNKIASSTQTPEGETSAYNYKERLLLALREIQALNDKVLEDKVQHMSTLTDLTWAKEDTARVTGENLVLHEKLDELTHTLKQELREKAVLASELVNLRGDMELLEDQSRTDRELPGETGSLTRVTDQVPSSESQPAHTGNSTGTKSSTHQSSDQKPAAKKLLIGASILRDVHPAGLKSTDVVSIGGATNQVLENKLKTMKLAQYEMVIVQCSTNDKSKPKEYGEGVTSLVHTMKQRAPDARLVLSTVCPRGDRQQWKVAGFNAVVQEVAEEENIQLVQSQDAFTNADGSLNHSLYDEGRLHLSRMGTSVLLRAIDQQVSILPVHQSTQRAERQGRKTVDQGSRSQDQHSSRPLSGRQRSSDDHQKPRTPPRQQRRDSGRMDARQDNRQENSRGRNSATDQHRRDQQPRYNNRGRNSATDQHRRDQQQRYNSRGHNSATDQSRRYQQPKYNSRDSDSANDNRRDPRSRNYNSDCDNNDNDRQASTSRAVRCHYCGEEGHVKGVCRHGKSIQCHSCNDYGHKAHHCQRDY